MICICICRKSIIVTVGWGTYGDPDQYLNEEKLFTEIVAEKCQEIFIFHYLTVETMSGMVTCLSRSLFSAGLVIKNVNHL